MRRICMITILAGLIICQSPLAENKIGFTISPELSRNFGGTGYEMDTEVEVEPGLIINARSELDFPLDVSLAGARATIYYGEPGRKDWSINVGLYKNLGNPSRLMKDSDWIGIPGVGEIQFGYTESDVKLSHTLFTIEATRRLYSWSSATTYILAGFRYQKIEQDIVGFQGWQLAVVDSVLDTIQISGTERALYYRITYKSPFLGMLYNLSLGRNASLDFSAAYMLVFASDYDDHLLRFKTATADGTGHGLSLALRFRYTFESGAQIARPFFELGSDFITQKISSKQTQTWYGDDPATEEDDTGLVVPGIPHDISTSQFTVGLRVGLEF